MAHYISSKFFCINCGKESIPLARKENQLHSKFHRKVLYCPWCKNTVNHIEVRNDEEAEEFRQSFEEGTFAEEAKESIEYTKNERKLY